MVVAGLLAGLVNYTYLTGDDAVTVVGVAAQDLQPGERLTAAAVTFVETRLEDPTAHELVTEEASADAVGRVVARRIASGELLSWTALVEPGADDLLRTMSIPIDPAHAVGGRLRPGDRVDVVAVEDEGARFIAVDLEVVAVADRSGAGALGGLSPYSVTVAVDGDAVLRIASAMRSDAIELIRSNGAAPASVPARSVGHEGDPAR